jgi:AraC-like DNA-binding protein
MSEATIASKSDPAGDGATKPESLPRVHGGDTPEVLTRAVVFRQDRIPLDLNRSHLPHPHGYPMHHHDFSELVIVLGGSGCHVTQTGRYPISRGDVFVLLADEIHGYEDTHGLEMANILFLREELDLPWAELKTLPGFHVLFTLEPLNRDRDIHQRPLRLPVETLRQMSAWVDRLERELVEQSSGWTAAALGIFLLMVADLSRATGEDTAARKQSLLRVGEVLSHIEQHYTEPITLAELAGVGCVSERSLTRSFRQAMGCSPIDYLIRLRIRRSLELLGMPGQTIASVAFTVGFHDSNYFSRQFRRVVGRSPKQWLKDGGGEWTV